MTYGDTAHVLLRLYRPDGTRVPVMSEHTRFPDERRATEYGETQVGILNGRAAMAGEPTGFHFETLPIPVR